jgi:hypothetical protein
MGKEAMRARWSWLTVLPSVVLGIVASAQGLAPGEEAAALRIVYSAGTEGQLETCGCSAGLHGGLARRATALWLLRDDGIPMLVIDGGGLVDDPAKGPYLASAYGTMEYALAILTAEDVASGLPDALTSEGLRVMTYENQTSHVRSDAGDLVVDVISAPTSVDLARVWDAHIPSDDAVITLGVIGAETEPANEADAASLHELDLILGPPADEPPSGMSEESPGWRAFPAVSKGKYLLVADVYVREGDQPHVEVSYLPVHPGLPIEDEVQASVERFYEEVSPRTRPAEPEDETVGYIMRGWADAETCGECHPAELASWRETQHADAIPTLARVNRLVDECLGCHSEQYRQTGALDPQQLVPGDGVTCATCHGSGVAHSMTGSPEHIEREPTADLCLSCHTEERQPQGFDYQASLVMVDHRRLDERDAQ